MAHERDQVVVDEEKTRARRQQQILNELGEAAFLETRKLLEDVRTNGANVLRAKELLKMAEIFIKLDRLVSGKSTESIDLGGGISYENLTDSELATLEALARKATVQS